MNYRSHDCKCRQESGRRKPLGLDELMIVNPSPAGGCGIVLGGGGMLKKIDGLGADHQTGLARYFLGSDGTLYKTD